MVVSSDIAQGRHATHHHRPIRTEHWGRSIGHGGSYSRLTASVPFLGLEISAICTHPDFNGRGYARRLTAMLTNDNLERGRTPFLHASHENHRALRMYEQLGYVYRPDIGFWSLRRA